MKGYLSEIHSWIVRLIEIGPGEDSTIVEHLGDDFGPDGLTGDGRGLVRC